MRSSVPTVLTLLVLVTAPCAVLPAADALKSGPQPGESIPGPFHYFNLNGPHAGHPHCLVCEFGLRPVALVFAREVPPDKVLSDLLQKLDEAVGRYKNAELRGGVVFLNDDFTKEENRRSLIQKPDTLVKDLKQIVVAVGGADGPEKYKINKDAEVTVLLYNKHKVVANFAFAKGKLTEKDVSAIVTAVEKMVGAK